MKKIMLIFMLFVLFFSCSEKQEGNIYDNVVDFSVSSPMENHIQYVDEFRLDMIWLDVVFNDHTEQIILDESMISDEDLRCLTNPGEHNITVSLGGINKKVLIVLYGNSTDKYYCINTGDSTRSVKAKNVYELEAPTKSNQYFAGWYIDEELTKPYDGEEVYNLYAKYNSTLTHRVRFYHENIIIKEEYVMDGKSANPPIMKSYNDFTFSHWNKDFNCIIENTDIYAVYKQNHFEVNFYDINNNVISRQVIENGKSASEPILEEVDGKVFIGWSADFKAITKPTNIYPIYSNKQEYYRVRFYLDSIEDANFLYEEYVEMGGSITKFTYEIPNYKLIKISESLTNINKNIDVICTYQIVENSFYVNNTLYTKLPCDQEFPIVILEDGTIGVWKKNIDVENRYDLIERKSNQEINISYDGQKMVVEIDEFLEVNPSFYIAKNTNDLYIFEWYYDQYFTRIIDDYSELFYMNQNTIYGKRVDFFEQDIETKYDIELIQINGISGYRFNASFEGNNGLCYIPNEYNGLPVISINYDLIDFSQHLLIGKNVIDIHIDEYEQAVYYNQRIIVHEDNPKYYDIDGVLYERGEYKDKLIRYPSNYNGELYKENSRKDFIVPNNTILATNCFNCVIFKQLHITKGCEFEGFTGFTDVQTLHIAKDIKELILAPNRQGGSIDNLIFEEGSRLERLESNIMLTVRRSFNLPHSVKYLEPRTQTELLMCHYDKMIIPDDHPYFKVVDNMILDQTGTVLIGLYRNQEYDTFTVPNYIKSLFLGCFFDTKINKLIFDYSVNIVNTYNGCKPINYHTPSLSPFMNRKDFIGEIVILNKPLESDKPNIDYTVIYQRDENGNLIYEERTYPIEDNGDYKMVSINYFTNGNISMKFENHYKKINDNFWLIDEQKEWVYNKDGSLNNCIIRTNTIENGFVINCIEEYYLIDERYMNYYRIINYVYSGDNLQCTIINEYNACDIKIRYNEYHLDELSRSKKNISILYKDNGIFIEKLIQEYFYEEDTLIKETNTFYDEQDNVISYTETIF